MEGRAHSPLAAPSCVAAQSSGLGPACFCTAGLGSSGSSSSGVTSFIRLWLQTLATSLMSECTDVRSGPSQAGLRTRSAPPRGCPVSSLLGGPLTPGGQRLGSPGLGELLRSLRTQLRPGHPGAPGPSQVTLPSASCSRAVCRRGGSWGPLPTQGDLVPLRAALVSALRGEGYSSCGRRRPGRAGQRSGSLRSRAA